MKWSLEVQKTGLERRNLSDLLNGIGYQLIKGERGDEITSPSLDSCSTAEEAWAEAKRLREVFTGPAEIDGQFSLGAVVNYGSTPPSRSVFAEVTSSLMLMTGVAAIEVAPPQGLTEEELQKWHEARSEQEYQAKLEAQRSRLEPAFLSSRASKVIELMNIDHPTGEILYKIYELAEGHPSKRTLFHTLFAIAKDDFDRFKDVVHNPTVSGDWARHAYEDKPKTTNPMTQEEAKRFVHDIAKKWLSLVRNNSNV